MIIDECQRLYGSFWGSVITDEGVKRVLVQPMPSWQWGVLPSKQQSHFYPLLPSLHGVLRWCRSPATRFGRGANAKPRAVGSRTPLPRVLDEEWKIEFLKPPLF